MSQLEVLANVVRQENEIKKMKYTTRKYKILGWRDGSAGKIACEAQRSMSMLLGPQFDHQTHKESTRPIPKCYHVTPTHVLRHV